PELLDHAPESVFYVRASSPMLRSRVNEYVVSRFQPPTVEQITFLSKPQNNDQFTATKSSREKSLSIS
ncbi:hypothetical protein PENTCL1PPCAC_24389, partial [Pristionchus entomophagus]